MKTRASNQQSQPSGPTPGICLPCDVPPFCRTSYYTGKLLTVRDFSDEQRYHIDKRRIHNTLLHGWGTVCGLKVKPHPHCPSLRIVVEPGLAIDHCGREVQLHHEIDLQLPEADAKPRQEDPCPPEPEASKQAEAGSESTDAQPDTESLWICLRYCEKPEQYSPAPFDECTCTGAVQKPNCVCESYSLEISTKEPSCLEAIEEHKSCGCEHCADLYKTFLDPCRLVRCDCIPLAVIRHYTPGKLVTEHMIDNWTHRPLLPSVHRLDQVVRCLLEKFPRNCLTHISDINWTHGADLRCHAFMTRFVGHDKGFEITFDGPVRHEGINSRSFRAMVAYHSGTDQPRRTEIAPAHVHVLDSSHIVLRIDETYAQKHLDNKNFDLFITLNCNVIIDHHGTPVDGDLLARCESDGSTYFVDPPTGDGVPGGLFESWVKVRSAGGHSEPW